MTWQTYASRRAAGRGTAADIVRHAVDHLAHLSGAHDSECGRKATVHLGPWQPHHPGNCQKCAAAVTADTTTTTTTTTTQELTPA